MLHTSSNTEFLYPTIMILEWGKKTFGRHEVNQVNFLNLPFEDVFFIKFLSRSSAHEKPSWMPRRQANTSHLNHRPFQNHKINLIIPNLAMEATRQLNDAENRPS